MWPDEYSVWNTQTNCKLFKTLNIHFCIIWKSESHFSVCSWNTPSCYSFYLSKVWFCSLATHSKPSLVNNSWDSTWVLTVVPCQVLYLSWPVSSNPLNTISINLSRAKVAGALHNLTLNWHDLWIAKVILLSGKLSSPYLFFIHWPGQGHRRRLLCWWCQTYLLCSGEFFTATSLSFL